MLALSKATLRRVKRRDKAARWVVTLGGMAVIASVIAIVALIAGTIVPLFRPARVRLITTIPLPASIARDDILAVGVEMGVEEKNLLVAHVLGRDGTVTFLDLHDGTIMQQTRLRAPGTDSGATKIGTVPRSIRALEQSGPGEYSLVWSDGAIWLVEVAVGTAGRRGAKGELACTVRTRATFPPEKGPPPLRALVRTAKDAEGVVTCAALLPDGRILLLRQVREENLLGEVASKTHRTILRPKTLGTIGPLALDAAGANLYAGTSDGVLLWWRLDDDGQVAAEDVTPAFRDQRAITALGLLLGDVSLAVGDAQGQLSTWFFVHSGSGSSRKLRQIHTLASHAGAVEQIVPAPRSKALLSLDAGGAAAMDYMTSERRLATLAGAAPLRQVGLSSRADVVLGLDSERRLTAWRILCPHPEISWRTLLGKVQYEGYDEPAYVWQTTGGDEYEPKMSLVPLLFGTLKATIYAMLFAVPLSLAAAAYVSHFTVPGFKQWIKPAVEIMAALPSVVIGFIAALWLAPIIQDCLGTVALCLLSVPATICVSLLAWQWLGRYDWARRAAQGREFLFVAPVLLLGVAAAVWMLPWLWQLLPGRGQQWLEGVLHYQQYTTLVQWLTQHLHLTYDQRNSIIIAVGLGFAVIPIIFSLAEDALSSVPHSMTAASLALGASRWQTLWRVVLPSASPGIFAAVMIGFGRAVGETMIVLMAAGNIPVMHWSPLDGMRTLSANIATEIPEAPVPGLGSPGTLYRVLFLCAVLLFVLTFLLNTAAEVVRQRLRKRYGQY